MISTRITLTPLFFVTQKGGRDSVVPGDWRPLDNRAWTLIHEMGRFYLGFGSDEAFNVNDRLSVVTWDDLVSYLSSEYDNQRKGGK